MDLQPSPVCASSGSFESTKHQGPANKVTGLNAFVPVAARRSLNQASPTSRPVHPVAPYQATPTPDMQIPKPPKKKVDWPPAVREYVQRCFVPQNLISGISKEDMEAKLKSVITQAAESNNLHSVNWAGLPLPQHMLQEERTRSLLSPSSVAFSRLSTSPPAPALFTPDPILHSKAGALRKRKSTESTEKDDDQDPPTPWRQSASKNGFEDRISFAPAADKRQRLDVQSRNASKSNGNLENRKKRFDNSQSGFLSPFNDNSSNANTPSAAEDTGPVIGRCQTLEKNYFRLTAAPNPDTVRPLSVLQKTLELLKRKWKLEANYTYICDQFKSLRQDLTVQHIRNEFTVNVYEIHARIALEKGDLGEYNQCQTQLRALYKQNLGGHPMEFKAYRILYFIHTCNRTDMNDVLSELTPTDKADRAVKHALDVRSALALGNYHRFFQLFLETPNMGAYLMDMFVARERLVALASICKA
jgi:SAC3 family protein LENG8/THP3